MTLETVSAALAFATEKLGATTDRGGRLAIFHLYRVSYTCDTPLRQVLGALHDVVEDTNVTFLEVEEKFGAHIARKLDFLTRQKDQTYAQYIDRLIGSHDADVLTVKMKDLQDNIMRCYGHFGSKPNSQLAEERYFPTINKVHAALLRLTAGAY